jgi:hypothetical protein
VNGNITMCLDADFMAIEVVISATKSGDMMGI